MASKAQKIISGDYNLFPSNAEKFPSAFLENSDTFVERWAYLVKKSYQVSGEDASKPIPGIVLAVTKNGKIKPSKVVPGSGKKAWWLCEKGHSYDAIIGNRTKPNGTGCPYCVGKKPSETNN